MMKRFDGNPGPRAAATSLGTVLVLGNSGDLIADIQAAIEASGSADLADFTDDELRRIRDRECMSAELKAEAGYGGGGVILILHTRTERLPSGQRIGCWLTLSQTPAGDALYYSVSVFDHWEPLSVFFATLAGADNMMKLLRKAAGKGESTEVSSYKAPIPDPDHGSVGG